LAEGGWFFRTVGGGQMLMPWGATERIIRKIDATDPADLTLAEGRMPQDGDEGDRPPARRGSPIP
jgi:hypothetical protein